jgi:hypothetical protein
MPMRKEVKLELKSLEKVIKLYQKQLGLPAVDPTWHCPDGVEKRVLHLSYLIKQI